ncbi:hypothetical protein K466DRAFT_657861 [Polyporus arcularius HHB13444]|uniref:Uncharacterized protein n=1 Tax=Polyporus arcularius HHB13444 TaxID=1314778 RepID=A0A5C3PWV2_9APHY|nr:hypothetical protein K466DRAFT_657861 [Polyporus arcularius HHB13444]
MSQCSSQTESEPEDSLLGWDAVDFQEMSAEIGRIGRGSSPGQDGIVQLTDALAILSSIDICAVANDEGLHETVRSISSTILLHLDRLVGQSDDDSGEERRLVLLALLDPDFLSLLFAFRTLFRAIAASSTDDRNASVIVCWADIIIVKLGQAITIIAGSYFDISTSDQVYPESVLVQREDDMLRAAVQLPGKYLLQAVYLVDFLPLMSEKWSDIVHAVTSDYLSPAAYRLCLCLLFGTFVMAPQLSDQSIVIERAERNALLRALQARLKRIVTKRNHDIASTLIDAGEQEQIALAIFVSLYAIAESDGDRGPRSPGRPQTQAALLEMIQAILRPEPSLSPQSLITPPADANTAIAILVRWGCTLPWAWRTWEDVRLHNSEVAEHLTATWLHNLDIHSNEVFIAHAVEYWDADLVTALQVEPRAALSMMLRLLFCTLCAVKDATPEHLSDPVLNVLLKICWSTRYLLQIVEVDNASSTALLGIICNLFVLLSDGRLELGIKDLIIEIMSMSTTTGLRGAVMVVSDPKSEFMFSLDRRLNQISRLYSDGGCRGTVTFADLRTVKQAIQLLTLMWTSGTSPRSVPQSAQRFLAALVNWLGDLNSDSEAWRVLGDAFIGIVAILEQRRADPTFAAIDRCWDELAVWRLAREADPNELPLASSFALYVGTMAHLRHTDDLFCAEAWDYFRDVLLLILTSDYEGPDEPLALLIAPSICTALIALLGNAQGASFHHSISSPWTLCMVTYLKNLQTCGSRDAEYAQILFERIGEQARLICKGLASRSPSTSGGSGGTREPPLCETVFCWIRSLPYLMIAHA